MNFFPSPNIQMGYCINDANIQARDEAICKQIEDPHLLPFEVADRYYDIGYYHKAFLWYYQAASKNNAYAQNRVGEMLQEGRGTNQDFKLAMHWYLEAHRNGYIAATNHIGLLYCEGLGVLRDFLMGLKWYLIAANVGYDVSQFNVGMHFEKGIGVNIDQQYALEWYERAAIQGHVGAQYAIIHLKNQGFYLSKKQKKYLAKQQMVMEHKEKGILKDRLQLAEQQLLDAELEKKHIDVKIRSLTEQIRVLKPRESNLDENSTSQSGEPTCKAGVDQVNKSVAETVDGSKNNV